MKKLMTLIGAAAMAFGLYAVDPYESTITFDAAPLGAFDLNATESGGRLLWWAADTNDIAATVTAYDPVDAENPQYLALETGTDPLFRTAAAVSVNESVKTPQQVDIGEGVVFNQRVKFSAFDSDPTDLDENAKIAVWLKAVDAEDGAPETNLYVSTAILDSETLEVVTRTNLVLLGANVEPDSWHQLTITAIPAYDLGDPDGIVPGFAIAVDGNVLSVAETLLPASIGDVYPTIGAAKLIAEKKLMPSRVRFDISQTLIGAGYQGSGAIDEIDVSIGGFEVTVDKDGLLPENVLVDSVVSTNGYRYGEDEDYYTFAKGDTIRFTLAPAPGYRFKDGKAQAVYEFDMTDGVSVEFDNTEAEEDTSTYPVKFINGELIVFSTNVTENTVVLEQPAPAAPEGQSFKGWCETNGEEFVVFDFSNVITNALDLFAKFTNNYYTVTYLTNSVEFATQNVEYGHATTAPDPAPVAPAGQSFAGWLEDGVAFSFDTLITNNITLTASFTADAYTLTLTAGDNTTLTASPDQASYAYGATVTLTATAESGFEFSSMPEDWTLVSATVLTKEITITENTTINGPAATAVAPSTYTVTFDYADGATAASNVTVAANATVAQPADPTRSGYTFDGWKLYGAAYDFSTAVTSNFTLTAAWTAAGGWDPNPASIPDDTPAATKYPELAGTALATADAKKLTIWADNNSVAFSAAEEPTATLVDAYLLNCEPTAEAVAAEKAAFKATITMSGSTATVTLPIGKLYNEAPVMKGSNDLSTWTTTETTAGYQFFKFVLELTTP